MVVVDLHLSNDGVSNFFHFGFSIAEPGGKGHVATRLNITTILLIMGLEFTNQVIG